MAKMAPRWRISSIPAAWRFRTTHSWKAPFKGRTTAEQRTPRRVISSAKSSQLPKCALTSNTGACSSKIRSRPLQSVALIAIETSSLDKKSLVTASRGGLCHGSIGTSGDAPPIRPGLLRKGQPQVLERHPAADLPATTRGRRLRGQDARATSSPAPGPASRAPGPRPSARGQRASARCAAGGRPGSASRSRRARARRSPRASPPPALGRWGLRRAAAPSGWPRSRSRRPRPRAGPQLPGRSPRRSPPPPAPAWPLAGLARISTVSLSRACNRDRPDAVGRRRARSRTERAEPASWSVSHRLDQHAERAHGVRPNADHHRVTRRLPAHRQR